MVTNMTMGGLGISYYRVLYVKAPNWLKYSIGEKRLLVIIFLIELFLITFFTAIFGSGQGSRAVIDICLGYYDMQVKKIQILTRCSFYISYM
jgi:hypothetical protein